MKKFSYLFIGLFFFITAYTTLKETAYSLPTARPLPGETGVYRQGALSALLATWNDEFSHQGKKYWIRRPIRELGSRWLSGPLFNASLAGDLFYSLGMTLWEGEAKKKAYALRARKDLLGLLASPLAILSPDLISHHFLPDERIQSTLHSYGKLYSAEAVQVFPETVEEVVEIVKRSPKVVIAGGMNSQGKQALPGKEDAVVLQMGKMNRVTVDQVRKVAIAEGGATWGEIQKAANEHKLAVKVMQASNIFTLGGSLSINCHGWDHREGALGETVERLTIVNPQGKIVGLTRNDPLFSYVIGGMGGFGVIVEAELSLAPNQELALKGTAVSPDKYLRYFREKVQTDPQIAMHYYRLSLEPGKLFQEGISVDYIDQGSAVQADLDEEPSKGRVIDRIELHMLRRLKWARALAWKEVKREALQGIRLSRNEAMRPPINAIFHDSVQDSEWLQEFFVPGEELAPFLRTLSTVLDRNKVPVFNASVRYVGKNSSRAFNYAEGREMFAVVLFFHQSMRPQEIKKTENWVQEVVDDVLARGGTYYLPYQNFPTVEQFRNSYPRWEEILAKKEEFDPERIFGNGFYDEYLFGESLPEGKRAFFWSVFDKENGMREEMKDFIQVIFKQLDEEKLLALVDDLRNEPEVYPKLYDRIGEASPGLFRKTTQALTALKELQNDLSTQAKELIGDRPLHGYVEIGYPGRMVRPLQKKLTLSGPVYVINEQESLLDYVESGFPRPYDVFVPLQNYEPISPDEIPSESVDLVAMFIGLHHTPVHKLDAFVRSIGRILRPGGIFLLMDHDAGDEKRQEFVSMVHTVFNAGTGVPPKEEEKEYRNFQSLEHWQGLLQRNGLFFSGKTPLVRERDPTLNSLMTFEKPLEFAQQPGVFRSEIQTYLTAPEWQNVRSSQAYAAFIEHTPFYLFPYFREIGNFWHVYASSWRAARERHSFWEVATSEYSLMNTFIGVMMTVEYGIKGLLSAPIARFYNAEENQQADVFHALVEASSLPPSIEIKSEKEGLKHIAIPRYREGTKLLIELAQTGGNFHSIAGQKRIQCDLLVPADWNQPLPPGAHLLYETEKSADPSEKYLAVEVEIPFLAEAIRTFLAQGVEISYIHEY